MSDGRVVITGAGLMCGLGLDLESSWEGILEGRRTIRRFTLFDPEGLASPFGVELPEGADEVFGRYLKTRQRKQMTRGTMIAVATAQMAIEDSGLEDRAPDRRRIGVVVGGTGTGYAPTTSETDRNRILKNMSSAPAAWISLKNKLEGPSFVVSTACSSATYAMHAARSLVASGECDAVVSGAGDSALNYLDVEGFCSLMALSEDVDNLETASRPFDRKRGGFVMGEGGGMVVLESLESAERRGAKIYAEMPAPGLGSESYNIMSPEPGGEKIARAMRLALERAGLEPGEIDYINAHGTSTPLNDLYETQAIKLVFGERAGGIPVSSTKSMTGHCLSAAAGVEAVICLKAMEEGVVPPTANLEEPDEGFDLDYVQGPPREKVLAHVMSNSFAFGGQNGVSVFSKVE